LFQHQEKRPRRAAPPSQEVPCRMETQWSTYFNEYDDATAIRRHNMHKIKKMTGPPSNPVLCLLQPRKEDSIENYVKNVNPRIFAVFRVAGSHCRCLRPASFILHQCCTGGIKEHLRSYLVVFKVRRNVRILCAGPDERSFTSSSPKLKFRSAKFTKSDF
jgi:hypothetical protein